MMKMWFASASLLVMLIFSRDSVMHNISRAYQKMYAMVHYDYLGIFDPECVKELSWKEKIFCQKSFANVDVMRVLHHIEDEEMKLISKNRKRNVDEMFFGDQRVIIKSMEFPGFFSNLFRMGMGVNVWNNAKRAQLAGIPVLKPIALVEKREWNKTKTFIVYLFEGKVCEQEIHQTDGWFSEIQEMKDQMENHLLIHDDLRMKNMVLLDNGTIQLIDIDKIHFYPSNSLIFRARMEREVRKFNQNLRENSNTQKCLH